MILIFTITETVVMYFFISTGAAIKTAITEGLGEDFIWARERKLKMVLFPQLMLTILFIGGWFIHIGAVENNMHIIFNCTNMDKPTTNKKYGQHQLREKNHL